MTSCPRYAIYYTPQSSSALAHTALAWIGRDAFTGVAVEIVSTGELSAEQIYDLSAFPRHYGFHGTLKAPFRLAKDKTDELRQAVASFAKEQLAFEAPALKLHALAGDHTHLTLVPEADSIEFRNLASACVKEFDHFRAELSDAEFQQRKPETLSERQRNNLRAFGYPYIFEDFRFHLTLSRSLTEDEIPAATEAAETHFADHIGKPLLVDGIGLFRQNGPDEDFIIDTYAPFAGSDLD